MPCSIRIEKRQRSHSIESFDCGMKVLNRFFMRYGLQNQQAGASQTYLALTGTEVIGYYSLAVCSIEYTNAPERLKKGYVRHPLLIMLLARLAIAADWQGKGMGSGLLKDAMMRTVQATEIAGIRAFAVLAKDDDAKAYYERFDFLPSLSDPYQLFRLMKDVRVGLS